MIKEIDSPNNNTIRIRTNSRIHSTESNSVQIHRHQSPNRNHKFQFATNRQPHFLWINKNRDRKKLGQKSSTVSQPDGGLLGIDIRKNAFVSHLAIGSEANDATDEAVGGGHFSGAKRGIGDEIEYGG